MHIPIKPVYVGAIILIFAEVLFAGVGALIKYLSETVNQSQLIFFRNLFATLLLLPWVTKGRFIKLKTGRLPLHFFRAFTGLTGMYCFFYVLANMPLSSAVLALKIAPFFIPVIAHYWLKEAISLKSIIAIIVGFIGVLFILDIFNPAAQFDAIFALIALFCAMLVATTKCTLSKLSDTEPALRIVFYFTTISTIVSFPIMVLYWQPIPTNAWWLIIAMSALAVLGQLFMTKAYQYASPVKIGLLGYSSVVFAAILGAIFWQQQITISLFIGMAFLLWAGNMTLRQKWAW